MNCRFLEWDSRFFNLRIARVEADRLTAKDAARVLSWSEREKIDGLYFLCPSDDDESVRQAEAAGFYLVDIRMELFCRLFDHVYTPNASIRLFQESDLSELQLIAENAYTDSRFYYDRNFSRERASALYREWATKNCHGEADAVFIAQDQDQIGGFITCNFDQDVGRIGLVGVSPIARGHGVGHMLVNAALNYFRDRSVAEVRVVTQGRNISAQRLYQAHGFRTHSLSLWYHKWRRNDHAL